jgi:hypothetical protein
LILEVRELLAISPRQFTELARKFFGSNDCRLIRRLVSKVDSANSARLFFRMLGVNPQNDAVTLNRILDDLRSSANARGLAPVPYCQQNFGYFHDSLASAQIGGIAHRFEFSAFAPSPNFRVLHAAGKFFNDRSAREQILK